MEYQFNINNIQGEKPETLGTYFDSRSDNAPFKHIISAFWHTLEVLSSL